MTLVPILNIITSGKQTNGADVAGTQASGCLTLIHDLPKVTTFSIQSKNQENGLIWGTQVSLSQLESSRAGAPEPCSFHSCRWSQWELQETSPAENQAPGA
ncbi:hypothetical protein KIL84_004844 [Mauremys mutica]|uniref:Uncharacterized protein n=1 Tax=Mauremys mutica TaxID=74926 RepID=A0A9D3XNT3_9SAUR|nr:hypothetical protein KIL84_004844 [Mauremys mutica]